MSCVSIACTLTEKMSKDCKITFSTLLVQSTVFSHKSDDGGKYIHCYRSAYVFQNM